MARAIPRDEWSEAEEYCERAFYWEYLVNTWLVPGGAVFPRPDADQIPLRLGPSTQSLQEYGWLMEPESTCEQ